MVEGALVNVFRRGTEWWAECLICRAWVSSGNETIRDADLEVGRHLQDDHGPEGKLGVVNIAWLDRGEDACYSAYWDGLGDGGMLERMPETPNLDVALAWANSRSERIRIRPSWDPARYYEAGARKKPGEPELGRP